MVLSLQNGLPRKQQGNIGAVKNFYVSLGMEGRNEERFE